MLFRWNRVRILAIIIASLSGEPVDEYYYLLDSLEMLDNLELIDSPT